MSQNINHVDRLAWVTDLTDLAKAALGLNVLTGLEFAGPYEWDGLTTYISVDGGLRIVAPAAGASTAAAELARRTLSTQGAGIFSLTFGVDNLDEARIRTRNAGFAPGPERDESTATWAADGILHDKTFVAGKFLDTIFEFGDVRYADGMMRRRAKGSSYVNCYLNRFDHIAWVCHPENASRWCEMLSILSGEAMDEPFGRQDLGVSLSINWSTGLEIVSPLPGSNAPMTKMLEYILEQRGESVFAIVYGVPDMAAARQRAMDGGYVPSEPISDPGKGPWLPKLKRFSESFVGEFLGIPFLYGEIEYNPGVITEPEETPATT